MNRRDFAKWALGAPGVALAQRSGTIPNRKLNGPMISLDLSACGKIPQRSFPGLSSVSRAICQRQRVWWILVLRAADGELVSDEKRVWFEGPGHLGLFIPVQSYRPGAEISRHRRASVRLLARSKPNNPEEFWPRTLNRDGLPASPPDTEVYSDLFVAEGLAEFSRASGERKVLGRGADHHIKMHPALRHA